MLFALVAGLAYAGSAAAEPTMVAFDQISAGDTAWMLASTALVLLMTIPGLALFYAGMVRKKNVLATTLQSFAVTALVTVLWVVIGYSLAFTPGSPFIGSLDQLFLGQLKYLKEAGQLSISPIAPTIPESVFIMYQLTFAIITPALITGAFAERMKFGSMLLFVAAWSLLVYAPVAHWVWSPDGWLAKLGAQDFAGGTVVHINAGAAGLACAYMLGRRSGYGSEPFIPYNLAFTLIGASLLWVGWFGFNAGSAVAADGRAGMAMLVTQVATATAVLTWMGVEWVIRRRASLLGACSGAVAGLVAITPASGFVEVPGALAIGAASGILCYWGATGLKRLLGADDSLDVFGIHGVGGLVGALLTGVFSSKAISGADASMVVQTLGAFATLFYSAGMTIMILLLIRFTFGLRVNGDEEQAGLDLALHGERIV
ncbi:ammonium transporter [Solimonas sp. K1W22B-7]|uniref:ammonium transporter n=1 Tax=Solimonas sp. K1W22B-7 TaxID=2303331 RepID=UPI000E336334|nr:ammonium transporter [Solimonas sp. K1W22B-7]AXQ30231.1 ammonium transporter [Solimonas sp. K1W22B-7]